MKDLGTTIRDRRKSLGVTQRELADIAGMSVNTITKIERGEGNPQLSVLSLLLDTLGLEIEVRIKQP
ncbi:MAG: helix-turn-helix domain-containing protein [Bacteroidaceae bacterium]|nr:helix-turn-helix domain-containing protein [Bacteroidaceae bacterium]